jgi:hypothetical protein
MSEHEIALMEGAMANKEDSYFYARPKRDTKEARSAFCAGFERGFKAALQMCKSEKSAQKDS